MKKKQKVIFKDLGLVDYKETWDYQLELMKEVIDIKRHNRNLERGDLNRKENKHYLIFCEHQPVYTLGRSGSIDNLRLSEAGLEEQNIDFYKINRGGDITFHGPGQVVAYPILDLDEFFTDVHQYVRYLEEVVIRTCAEYGLEATRLKGFTGVWLEGKNGNPNRKICAIGVHLSRWVTMHGFAFNVNTGLDFFQNIIPCGIVDKDKAVTSLSKELDQVIDMLELKNKLKFHFQELYEFELLENGNA